MQKVNLILPVVIVQCYIMCWVFLMASHLQHGVQSILSILSPCHCHNQRMAHCQAVLHTLTPQLALCPVQVKLLTVFPVPSSQRSTV